MAYNKVILVGRIASDIELKQTKSGKSVCQVQIAVRKNADHTDFFPVVAWDKTAETIARLFRKGDGIGVEGELSTRRYDDQTGKKTVTEVVCGRVFFTEGAKSDAGSTQTPPTPQNANTAKNSATVDGDRLMIGDDLPF